MVSPIKECHSLQPTSSNSQPTSSKQTQKTDNIAQKKIKKGKSKTRCHICRKKVGLLGFKCVCEGIFCSAHRYHDQHNCPKDIKKIRRQAILRKNATSTKASRKFGKDSDVL